MYHLLLNTMVFYCQTDRNMTSAQHSRAAPTSAKWQNPFWSWR